MQKPFAKIAAESSPVMPDEFGEDLTRDSSMQNPSDSQIYVGASSLQFSPLIFYRVQVRGLGRSCLFWTVVLIDDPTTAHYKISSRGQQV